MGGLLGIDREAVEAEANLDSKFLLRCSEPKLSAEDIALGYKKAPAPRRKRGVALSQQYAR
ncbi:hypothetical protein [Micromonospora sp. NPDC049240]|uniref:hypothetical protein n=1 Tax=Micromonospora sp. NPDC049240 TaxID=3155151 RepID=UPI0033FB7967